MVKIDDLEASLEVIPAQLLQSRSSIDEQHGSLGADHAPPDGFAPQPQAEVVHGVKARHVTG
jgi:hypothetical protein